MLICLRLVPGAIRARPVWIGRVLNLVWLYVVFGKVKAHSDRAIQVSSARLATRRPTHFLSAIEIKHLLSIIFVDCKFVKF